MDTPIHFPHLNRDLAILGGGLVGAVALLGTGIGIAVDVLVHRHRER